MRFDRGLVKKSMLLESMVGTKEAISRILLKHTLDLFKDEDTLDIIGNSTVEVLLVELAEICTNQLKTANESVKNNIVECLKEPEA